MKRFFCVLLLLVLFSVSCAFAEAYIEVRTVDPVVTSHYSVSVNGADSAMGKGDPVFDFNSLCIDLYLTDSEDEAFLLIACCKDKFMRSTGFIKVSVLNDENNIYFSSSSGLYLIGRWDENGTDLWIDYSGKSFRLRPVPAFSVYSDWE